MKKLTPLTIMMGVGLMLTACQAKDGIPAKYQPRLNPHPKYFMTVKGKIDPALKGDLQLAWYAYFYTTNPKCDKTVNHLEGVTEPLSLRLNYALNVQKNGNYQLKIPLDYYLPGKCGWVISGISYSFVFNEIYKRDDADTAISFNQKARLSSASFFNQKWVCTTSQCKLTKDSLPAINLNPTQNYILYLGFEGV